MSTCFYLRLATPATRPFIGAMPLAALTLAESFTGKVRERMSQFSSSPRCEWKVARVTVVPNSSVTASTATYHPRSSSVKVFL